MGLTKKTDKLDARGLAILLGNGTPPEIKAKNPWWRCDENFPGPARRDKLLRLNKMTATNRQIPDKRAAHDIRSCLQYSMGYVELLLSGKGGPPTPKQIEYLTQIRIGNEKILDILNRLDQSDNLPPEL